MALLAHDGPEPLYLQIKALLLEEMRTGRYVPHQRLPSERELSLAHGVSRMTVRQALVELQRSGATYARVGKGTFVASPKIDQQLRSVTSFTEELRARGGKPSSRVIDATIAPANADVAAALGLTPGAAVMTLARVRLADGRPLAIETALLPAEPLHGLLEHDFSRESLYEVLSGDYGLTLIAASQTIEAALAEEQELALLGMDPPAAVLRMRRLTQAADGKPIELVFSTYRGDLYQLHSNLEPARTAR
jgi:GntR family transcriptional regulator